MVDELGGLAVGRIDAQDSLIRVLRLRIPLLCRPFAPQLQVDFRGFVLHVFLQAQFRHPLLRIQVRGILCDDPPIDVQRVFAFTFFEIVLPEGEIILHGTAQQTSFGIEIAEMPIDVVPGRIDLQNFLECGNGLQRGAFCTKGVGGLQKGRDGVVGRTALEMQFSD